MLVLDKDTVRERERERHRHTDTQTRRGRGGRKGERENNQKDIEIGKEIMCRGGVEKLTSHNPTKHNTKKAKTSIDFFFSKKSLALSFSAVMFSSVFQFLFVRTL